MTAFTTSRLLTTIMKKNTDNGKIHLSFNEKKPLVFGVRFWGGIYIWAKGCLRNVNIYKSQSTNFITRTSDPSVLHPSKPSPPRVSSTSRLTIGILLGSFVQIRPLRGHDVRYIVGNDIGDGMLVEAGEKKSYRQSGRSSSNFSSTESRVGCKRSAQT